MASLNLIGDYLIATAKPLYPELGMHSTGNCAQIITKGNFHRWDILFTLCSSGNQSYYRTYKSLRTSAVSLDISCNYQLVQDEISLLNKCKKPQQYGTSVFTMWLEPRNSTVGLTIWELLPGPCPVSKHPDGLTQNRFWIAKLRC